MDETCLCEVRSVFTGWQWMPCENRRVHDSPFCKVCLARHHPNQTPDEIRVRTISVT